MVELLNLFNKINIDEIIVRVAGEFKRRYKITLADAIIAATSFVIRCKLATKNIKDFKHIKEITAEEHY